MRVCKGKENSKLILWECVLDVCVSLTVEGTEPVLFEPAGRSVFEGVTQRVAAVSGTCTPLDLDRRPAHHCVLPIIDFLPLTHTLNPSLCLTYVHTDVTSTHPAPLPQRPLFSDVSVLQRCACHHL